MNEKRLMKGKIGWGSRESISCEKGVDRWKKQKVGLRLTVCGRFHVSERDF